MTPEQFNALPRDQLEKLIGSLPTRRFVSLVGPRFHRVVLELKSRKLMALYDQLDRCLEADYATELLANAFVARAAMSAKQGMPPGSLKAP